MSVGWKRQTETDTLCDFALMVKLFAEQAPRSQKLQALALKARLTAEMAMQRERADAERGDILCDRAKECQWCHVRDICRKQGQRQCASTAEKARIIQQHFGDEGLNFIRWACTKADKMEESICTK